MHLQIIVRGLVPQVRLFESIAQGQYFKWRRTNIETGEEEIVLVQGGLRQSVLGTYEYIFPKEALSEVLGMFGFYKADEKRSFDNDFMTKARLATLRKLCGVKKVPKKAFVMEDGKTSVYFKETERGFSQCDVPGVTAHLIGYKEDPMAEMFDPMIGKKYIQEML